jgi:CRP-like cAMP-binding protein
MSPAPQTNRSPGGRTLIRKTSIDPPSPAPNAIFPSLLAKTKRDFDPHAFLPTIGEGRKFVLFPKKQGIFARGDTADAVFHIQTGKVRLTVVSNVGKEATIGILGDGEFFGEGALAGQVVRMCSATAMTDCAVLRIDKKP